VYVKSPSHAKDAGLLYMLTDKAYGQACNALQILYAALDEVMARGARAMALGTYYTSVLLLHDVDALLAFTNMTFYFNCGQLCIVSSCCACARERCQTVRHLMRGGRRFQRVVGELLRQHISRLQAA